jgi:hypothetical protein
VSSGFGHTAVSASALVSNQASLRAIEALAKSRIAKLTTERHHDRVNKSRKEKR